MPVTTGSRNTGRKASSSRAQTDLKVKASRKRKSLAASSFHKEIATKPKSDRSPKMLEPNPEKYEPVRSSASPSTLAAPGLRKITPDPTKALVAKLPRSTAKEIGLKEPLEGDAKTLFALFLAADLSSAPISHDLAFKTVRKMMSNGWDDVEKLRKSSWQEKTEVLTEGGYTRYRERTATFLTDVAVMMADKYDGDLNNLFRAADGDMSKTRQLLKEFKGMGDTGVDIFLRDAQMFFDYLVPFGDEKALQAAERAGIGNTPEEMYERVGKDPKKLSALCTSLVIGGF